MPDAEAAVVRRFYESFAARDFDAVRNCFAPDALWHLPGKSAIAGDHVGWDQIFHDFLAKIGPLSGGTFKAELMDIAVGTTYVVAIQHATASHNGKVLDITGCQLMTVKDGMITEVRGHYSDQEALDSFWA
ncbi:MAG TPA: nuclear transport factor 2 family protein [Chloroflexota bacterium]|nr:nuclear transport factor 2 family protein [Chloroflexota bacterium]